jgi:uncharacterized protein (TIGR02453 family)
MRKQRSGYLSPKLFQFFVELAQNNERAWFQANKSRYEGDVRDPLLELIRAIGPKLAKVSKHLLADPRPVGGSLFRLHRDVRFSKDKSPYKTHAGVHFRHRAGKDVHAPGVYLHLEPRQVFLATGMWHPDPVALAKIRGAIAERSKDWNRAISGKAFRAKCELSGELLSRPPKGFAKDHPEIEHLRRKDFITHTPLSERIACSPDLLEIVIETSLAAKPMMAFLAKAIELPF